MFFVISLVIFLVSFVFGFIIGAYLSEATIEGSRRYLLFSSYRYPPEWVCVLEVEEYWRSIDAGQQQHLINERLKAENDGAETLLIFYKTVKEVAKFYKN